MSDKRPKCKDCGTQHRLGTEHSPAYYIAVSGRTVALHPREAELIGVNALPASVNERDETATKPQGGRPRRYASDADRKKAYRERKRG